MKENNWRRYLAMGIALLLAVLMLAGLVLPYLPQ